MTLEGKSLHVLTPMYGGMCGGNYLLSMMKLQACLAHYNVGFNHTYTLNESLVMRARNRLVDQFVKESTHTHAVFIDADIGFEPMDLLAMMEFDRDIMGAGCTKKSLRWDRIQDVVRKSARKFTGEELMRVGGDYVINFEHGAKTNFTVGEPVEVKHLGTGLLMIKREVFTSFMEKYPDRWYESRGDPAVLPGPTHDFFRAGVNLDTREYDSEDYGFCQDSKAIGFKVWLCPWMKTTHQGTHTFLADIPAMAALGGSL